MRNLEDHNSIAILILLHTLTLSHTTLSPDMMLLAATETVRKVSEVDSISLLLDMHQTVWRAVHAVQSGRQVWVALQSVPSRVVLLDPDGPICTKRDCFIDFTDPVLCPLPEHCMHCCTAALQAQDIVYSMRPHCTSHRGDIELQLLSDQSHHG